MEELSIREGWLGDCYRSRRSVDETGCSEFDGPQWTAFFAQIIFEEEKRVPSLPIDGLLEGRWRSLKPIPVRRPRSLRPSDIAVSLRHRLG
jgi:hypothetical protein